MESWSKVAYRIKSSGVQSPGTTRAFWVEAPGGCLGRFSQTPPGGGGDAHHARRLIEGPRRQRNLDDIWQEVGQDPAFPWSLDELAHLAGIGPERLRRLCQRQYGKTPMGMVTSLRMCKAADLLAQGQPVREVATQVGYSNGLAFSTVFSRQYGQVPSDSQRRALAS